MKKTSAKIYTGNGFEDISENKSIELSNHVVAFLDILGFKALIKNEDLKFIADKYRELLKIIEKAVAHVNNNTCKYYVFSDSIMLISNDDSEDAFLDLIRFAWRVLQLSIFYKLPIRGGISYGKIYFNESKNIFIGQAIVDAVQLESKQEWIGIMLDEKVSEKYENIFSKERYLGEFYDDLLCKYRVPLKNGIYSMSRVINWRINVIVESGIKHYLETDSDREDVKRKMHNTLLFSKSIRNTGKIYVSDIMQSTYPFLYIGKDEPTFEPGDEY